LKRENVETKKPKMNEINRSPANNSTLQRGIVLTSARFFFLSLQRFNVATLQRFNKYTDHK